MVREVQHHDTPSLVCVECAAEFDVTSGFAKPEPGDFSLCVECASLNVFDENMLFRRPTVDEMLEAAVAGRLQEARRNILRLNK